MIWLFLQSEISMIEQYLIVFNKTNIPLELVGFEMIILLMNIIRFLYPMPACGIILLTVCNFVRREEKEAK